MQRLVSCLPGIMFLLRLYKRRHHIVALACLFATADATTRLHHLSIMFSPPFLSEREKKNMIIPYINWGIKCRTINEKADPCWLLILNSESIISLGSNILQTSMPIIVEAWSGRKWAISQLNAN